MSLPERRQTPRTEPFDTAIVLGRREQDAASLTEFARPLVAGRVSPIRCWETPESAAASPDEVIASIVAEQPDVVIRAAPRSTDDGGVPVDAMDTTLIRRCPCPVWFTDPGTDTPPRRVLAAINPVLEDRVDQATAVLKLAQRVAEGVGAELHVLHAWIAFGDTLLRPRMSPDGVESYIRSQRETAARRIEWSMARAGVRLLAGRLHLHKGHFREVLPDVTRGERIDLVVMGTRGRQGKIAAALVRPYPEVVLRKCPGPLLVVKSPA